MVLPFHNLFIHEKTADGAIIVKGFTDNAVDFLFGIIPAGFEIFRNGFQDDPAFFVLNRYLGKTAFFKKSVFDLSRCF